MSRFGSKQKVTPRGAAGAIAVVIVALFLVWLAFYEEPWVPHGQSAATTTPPVASQYELTEADNGKSFSYPVTSRFTVILDSRRYPMPPACVPAGIVGTISNIPAVQAPLAAARFEAVVPGSCTLMSGHWQVVIIVTN